MRAADVLYLVNSSNDRVKDIANALGIDPAGRKKEVLSRMARSLGRKYSGRGGRYVIPHLLRSELIVFVQNFFDFYGLVPRSSLSALAKAELFELVIGIVEASSGTGLARVLADRRWSATFPCPEFEFSEDDDDEPNAQEPSDAGAEDVTGLVVPYWKTQTSFAIDREQPGPAAKFQEGALFAHQVLARDRLTDWFENEQTNGVLCLPTGAGKTRSAVAFLLRDVVPQRRVLWLAHRVELIDQAILAFAENSEKANGSPFVIARYQRGMKHLEAADVVVASLQTLMRSTDGLSNVDHILDIHEEFDIIVIDECHHAVAAKWSKAIKTLARGRRVLGLSATPIRRNAKEAAELWKLFDHMVHEERMVDLIQQRILAHPEITVEETEETFNATDRERREFERFKELPASLIKTIARDPGRNERIVRRYLERPKEWGQTLIFAATVEQATSLVTALCEHGVRAASLDGQTPSDERTTTIQKFKTGEISVLVNVYVLSEGTDLPSVETVFIGRPTRSETSFRQMVGRGMRGPAVGGTEKCSIVLFNDHLKGLGDCLTSSFENRRRALEAMGLPEDGPERPSPAIIEALRDLEKAMDQENARKALSRVPLVGWWEIERDPGTAIPVFQDDEVAIRTWVSRVAREQMEGEAPTTPFVLRATFSSFARMMLEGGRERFVLVGGASLLDKRAIAASVLGALRAPEAARRPSLQDVRTELQSLSLDARLQRARELHGSSFRGVYHTVELMLAALI